MKSSDIKISTLLQLGFGMLALLIVLMGSLSFFKASGAEQAFGNVVDNRYPTISALHTINDRVKESSMLQRDLLLLSDADDIKKTAQTILTLQKDNSELLAKLDPAFQSEKGRVLLKALADVRTQYLPVSQRFISQASSGAQEMAKTVLQTEMAPMELKYFAAVDALIAFQEEQMQLAKTDAASAIGQIRSTSVLSGVVALLLATLAAVWITRAVTRPIN